MTVYDNLYEAEQNYKQVKCLEHSIPKDYASQDQYAYELKQATDELNQAKKLVEELEMGEER